jgi:DNA-binding MarR family transcriptional regulator
MKELRTLLKTNHDIPIQRAIILETFFTSSHFREQINLELKTFDLSIEQFNVLRILRGQNGKPLNLQDIQERMVTKMSNTSRLIDKLILKGLVVRSQCKNNRRKIDIAITPKGIDLTAKVSKVVSETEHSITKGLNNKELETLALLLNKVRNQ